MYGTMYRIFVIGIAQKDSQEIPSVQNCLRDSIHLMSLLTEDWIEATHFLSNWLYKCFTVKYAAELGLGHTKLISRSSDFPHGYFSISFFFIKKSF